MQCKNVHINLRHSVIKEKSAIRSYFIKNKCNIEHIFGTRQEIVDTQFLKHNRSQQCL